MSQAYRNVTDSEIVMPHDVVVKSGVYFETSSEVVKKLKEIVSDPESWAFSNFDSVDSDFLVCMPNGYGNGSYRVSRIKELVGKGKFGAILRLFPAPKDTKISSYSTPLPLP